MTMRFEIFPGKHLALCADSSLVYVEVRHRDMAGLYQVYIIAGERICDGLHMVRICVYILGVALSDILYAR